MTSDNVRVRAQGDRTVSIPRETWNQMLIQADGDETRLYRLVAEYCSDDFTGEDVDWERVF